MVKARRREEEQDAHHVDFGPLIRRVDVVVPPRTNDNGVVVAGYVREADVIVIDSNRGGDGAKAIRWLPAKMFALGKLTMAQAAIAGRLRDHIDMAAGVSDSQGGVGHSAPWARSAITDIQLAAKVKLEAAQRELEPQVWAAVNIAVVADYLSEVAMCLGIAPGRATHVVATSLDVLDSWWGGRG